MKKTLVAALLGATLLGGGAYAATQGTAARVKADGNGDGVVTRAEAMAHAEARFARIDANNDGKLSRDERRAFRPMHGRGHGRFGQDAPGAGGGREGRRAEMLQRFDADKEGKLSDTERQAARAAFHQRMLDRFDADKDGKLSDAEREAARGQMRGMRGARGDGPTPPPADAPDAPNGN
jgi:hypothetical protein